MQPLFTTLILTVLTLSAVRPQDIDRPTTAPIIVRKAGKPITPATYTGRQLLVGSGGGVTGASTTYYLLDNGRLYGRRHRDSAFTFIGTQTTIRTKRLFTTVENTCKIRTIQFDNPGNRYQFVGWRKGRENYKVTWGEPGTTPPASYPQFYKTFMTLVPVAKRL